MSQKSVRVKLDLAGLYDAALHRCGKLSSSFAAPDVQVREATLATVRQLWKGGATGVRCAKRAPPAAWMSKVPAQQLQARPSLKPPTYTARYTYRMAAAIPAKLRDAGIAQFARRAAQVEKFKPIIAYWRM